MIRKDFKRLTQDCERVKDDLSLDGKGRQSPKLGALDDSCSQGATSFVATLYLRGQGASDLEDWPAMPSCHDVRRSHDLPHAASAYAAHHK
jgi:hypothetical protein